MNRKQWFVLGIGFILLYVFYAYMGVITDCSNLSEKHFELLEKSIDIDFDTTESTLWLIECYNDNAANAEKSTLFFSFGVLFIICGFLEPKIKKK